ncbi:MAG: hypothetical protein JW936_07755 [Sedimentisphaerales bacterium]|nr:hypothetical protein [Sedimentisphaerales bacterium]
MNSLQRVQITLDHKQPDRVPVEISMAPDLRRKMKQHLSFDDAQLDQYIANDFAFIGPVFKNPASEIHYADPTIEVTPQDHYLDIYRVPFKKIETQFQTYIDLVGNPPLRQCDSIQELDDFPWPTPNLWDYSNIEADIQAHPQKATWAHSRGFFEIAHFIRGMEEFMMDLALNPDFACRLMDHIAEYLLERTRCILQAAKGKLTICEYNDDVASQNGLLMSPDMWRQFVKPRMARFCDLIHQHGAKVKYHSCGSVRAIIPDLIEIGVDILNPIQPLAQGMDPFELKREFGKDLVFHGGIDIQELLPNADVQQVRDHTQKMIDIVGKDGGYILSGSHCLQADAPAENIIALIEQAKK